MSAMRPAHRERAPTPWRVARPRESCCRLRRHATAPLGSDCYARHRLPRQAGRRRPIELSGDPAGRVFAASGRFVRAGHAGSRGGHTHQAGRIFGGPPVDRPRGCRLYELAGRAGFQADCIRVCTKIRQEETAMVGLPRAWHDAGQCVRPRTWAGTSQPCHSRRLTQGQRRPRARTPRQRRIPQSESMARLGRSHRRSRLRLALSRLTARTTPRSRSRSTWWEWMGRTLRRPQPRTVRRHRLAPTTMPSSRSTWNWFLWRKSSSHSRQKRERRPVPRGHRPHRHPGARARSQRRQPRQAGPPWCRRSSTFATQPASPTGRRCPRASPWRALRMGPTRPKTAPRGRARLQHRPPAEATRRAARIHRSARCRHRRHF
jgi:hypothetical protein